LSTLTSCHLNFGIEGILLAYGRNSKKTRVF
jgi:hypothetical protein